MRTKEAEQTHRALKEKQRIGIWILFLKAETIKKILKGCFAFNLSQKDIKDSTVPELLTKIAKGKETLSERIVNRRKLEQAKQHQDKILNKERVVDSLELDQQDQKDLRAFYEQTKSILQNKREGLAELKIRYVEGKNDSEKLDLAIEELESAFESHIAQMDHFERVGEDTWLNTEPFSASVGALLGELA